MTGVRTEEIRDFLLPDLGEGLEDTEIVEWHVAEGDRVELNQALASVETAKAVVEVPSPFAGTVVETLAAVGETLGVGQVLVRIATGSPSPSGTDEPKLLVGYGAQQEARSRRRRSAGRPLAKPPARKLAKELGIELAGLPPGSGPGGAITRADVERAASPVGTPGPSDNGHGSSGSTLSGEKAVPGFRGRYPGEVEQVRGIRKRIITRMERSRRDIPHALCTRDADVTELWRLREVLTARAAADGFPVKITPMAVICRAVLTALRRFPTLNARYDREAGEIRLLEPINLGIAVDTERGLMVPNIKDAHRLTTLQIAERTAELAGRCRSGTATPRDLTGGTFTVDNYGYFGTDDGDPIINAPEAAILGIGTIRERPWVVEGGLAVRRVVAFTLAFDHRVCDGGEAGRFVTYLAELCEEPARILLHG
ncbi:dihydrolipoamide acetyltransferase family protein [Pseudonocardia eucalypti]|uniref:Dihydrolipoamide acetyltransferase component of pyruvate dehydrogenase complex n=1 Tax=Pseudonocardia eucalypti TaxID=648755 RepID=A0ABP9PNQ4_9PSEU|nr:pyruvate dehydrogenase E2 component (dihydrolipoamide acetyltransferase) [Pseudonocardia eucalypti]